MTTRLPLMLDNKKNFMIACALYCRHMVGRDRMEISELVPSSSASVEGVFVGNISPIKMSRTNSRVKYFEGHLSDGAKTVRFVSFEPKLRSQVEEAKDNLCGVALKNCTVKRSRDAGGLEVLVSSQTKITNSPKKFKVDERALNECDTVKSIEIVSLDQLQEVTEQQYVTVKGKVVLGPTEKVTVKNSGKVLTKRDCEFADSTAIFRCVTWEEQVELFKEDQSYKLNNATIRSFNGAKYLSLGEVCDVELIEDIGEVIDDENSASQSGSAKVVLGEIVAVVSI